MIPAAENNAAGGLGIELGKLTQYKYEDDKGKDKSDTNKNQSSDEKDDNDSHSSSDEEPEPQDANDSDVPVMDLFAGNFNYTSDPPSTPEVVPEPITEFANFANFDTDSDNFTNFGNLKEDTSADSADNAENAVTDADDDMFGPFSGATAPASSPSEPSPSDDTDKRVADIDDIFGKGDHSELLEFEDFGLSNTLGENPSPQDAAVSAVPTTAESGSPAVLTVDANAAITEVPKEAETAISGENDFSDFKLFDVDKTKNESSPDGDVSTQKNDSAEITDSNMSSPSKQQQEEQVADSAAPSSPNTVNEPRLDEKESS